MPSQTPIGTIRCTRAADGAYYKLSRLAVRRDFRRFRLGRALVLALHAHVRADACARARAEADAPGSRVPGRVRVVCHSQIPAKGFYAK